MKRTILTLIVCLAAFMTAQAQTILRNNKFWDGEMLYTAQPGKGGIVVLKGTDIQGNTCSLTLKKKGKRAGEYTLQRNGDEAPYGCLWGCRVRYIRQSGMNFLAFYVEEHTIGQTLVLTPDNVVDCFNQQRCVEEENNPLDLTSSWLMNQKFLKGLHPEVLQGMLNKLQKSKKKTIIESTNQQLIAYVLAMELYASDVED